MGVIGNINLNKNKFGKIEIFLSKIIVYFLLLSLINYIFYFSYFSILNILIISFLILLILSLSVTMSLDGIIKLWIWLFVLYPKKNIGIEHSNSFIESYLLGIGNVNYSFFLSIVVPIYILSYTVVAIKNKKKNLTYYYFYNTIYITTTIIKYF